jgi:hypothetical protein
MGKSSQEKIEYAQQLLRADIPYREIQEYLKLRFGSGMSNTTLQALQVERDEIGRLKEELKRCHHQLDLYKRLYHELLEKLQGKL